MFPSASTVSNVVGNTSAVQPQLSFSRNNNHVDGWSYDGAGNLLNDGRNSYTYDAEGRIVSLNGAPTYVYDAEGRRVAKYSGSTITASYLLDLGGNQVTEFNGSGTWMHSNVWAAGGRLLATYEGPGEPHPNTYHFHLTDWLGTERMQTTAPGNNEEVCYSYPFGDGLTCTGSDATEHHFTSKMRDTESGLDYFGARYLSSDLGRFMTPDFDGIPSDRLEPVPYAVLRDPQSMNLYAYVENNPNAWIDFDGHVGGDAGSDEVNQEMAAEAANAAGQSAGLSERGGMAFSETGPFEGPSVYGTDGARSTTPCPPDTCVVVHADEVEFTGELATSVAQDLVNNLRIPKVPMPTWKDFTDLWQKTLNKVSPSAGLGPFIVQIVTSVKNLYRDIGQTISDPTKDPDAPRRNFGKSLKDLPKSLEPWRR
jgi:RHS repeat-associated protein